MLDILGILVEHATEPLQASQWDPQIHVAQSERPELFTCLATEFGKSMGTFANMIVKWGKAEQGRALMRSKVPSSDKGLITKS